jgi:hypothetical protein
VFCTSFFGEELHVTFDDGAESCFFRQTLEGPMRFWDECFLMPSDSKARPRPIESSLSSSCNCNFYRPFIYNVFSSIDRYLGTDHVLLHSIHFFGTRLILLYVHLLVPFLYWLHVLVKVICKNYELWNDQ